MAEHGRQFRLHPRMHPVHDRVAWLRQNQIYLFNQIIEGVDEATQVTISGRALLNFGSYSYLGLIGDARVREAAIAALDEFGTGTHGVRFLAGTEPVHVELEESLADVTHSEAAISFSSGYAANLAVLQAVLGRNDEVYCDKLNHASILDGIRLSGARLIRYRHNDPADLARRMAASRQGGTKLVVTDGVFSMDGDIADLPSLRQLCDQHDAWLMVDEAHALGVLGPSGRGIEEHYGIEDAIDIRMGSLSKAIPASGGYIAGSSDLIDYLRHTGRAYLFSGALPPPIAAAANTALEILQQEPERVAAMQANAARWRGGLQQLGFDTLASQTSIVPIHCGDDNLAFELAAAADRQGVFSPPVVSPAVPADGARLRTTVTASHDPLIIDRGLDALSAAAAEIGFTRRR